MPTLIPELVTVTAQDSAQLGYVSNDPFFTSVVMLLHADGAGTAVVDSSLKRNVLAASMSQTATTPKFGAACLIQTAAPLPNAPYVRTLYAPGAPLDILGSAAAGSADFTVDGWVWVDTASPSTFFIVDIGGSQGTFGQQAGLVFGIAPNGGSIQLFITTNIANSVSTTTWRQWNPVLSGAQATSAWHHLAVVRKNGVPFVFWDGVSIVANIAGSDWTNCNLNTATSMYFALGNTSSVSGTGGTGKIDEFRVTAGVARWTANFTPPTAPTVAYPVYRGYGDGSIDGAVFGSAVPNPPLVDFDPIARLADHTAGTATSPIFTFELSVEGEMLSDDLVGVSFIDAFGAQQNLLTANATFSNPLGTYGTWSWPQTKNLLPVAVATPFTITFEDPNQEFNCHCSIASPYKTLAAVRQKMLIRLGYPNQLANPPPGMATLVDQFLRDAQDQIYRQLQRAALWTERFYRWTMVPGQRYYGLRSNDNVCDAIVDPYKITWVGFEDLNKAWYRLDEGVPPEYYTRANINFGWPTRFEVRSCIEIFPAPQAAYTLWVKGDFPPAPLVADGDLFTIDDVACFLLALGNAKAHYGQKDAQLVLTQAGNYTKALVAGTHGTKRYVPRSETESPLTPPRFLPLGNSQA